MFASLGPDLTTFSESHNAAVGGLIEALCDKVYQQVSSQVTVLVAASVAGVTSDLKAMEQKQMTTDQRLRTIEETLQNFLHNMQGFADDTPPPSAQVKETIIVKETIVVEQVVVGPSEEEKAAEKAAKLAEVEARVKEAQLKAEEDARLAAEAAEAARLRDESDAASKAELERLAAEAAASAARAEEMLLQAGEDRAEAERLEAERREADRLAAEAAEAAASAAAAAAVANAELRVENTPEASARARKYWKWAFSRIKAKNLVRRMVFSMSSSRAPKGQSIMERIKSLEGLYNDHKNQLKAQEESAEVRDRRRR
jgi:hypothetical protein